MEAILFSILFLIYLINSNKVDSNIKLCLLSFVRFKNTFRVTLNHLVKYSKGVNFTHLFFYDNL